MMMMLKHKTAAGISGTRFPFLSSQPNYAAPSCFPIIPPHRNSTKIKPKKLEASGPVKAVLTSSYTEMSYSTTVKVVITVLQTDAARTHQILIQDKLVLQLVAAHLDPESGKEKPTIDSYVFAHKTCHNKKEKYYESRISVPRHFGEIGAVIIENEQDKEMFVKNIKLHSSSTATLYINSWIYPNDDKRVFFSNKAYLSSQTPSGLKSLREEELISIRGDGKGERKASDRIYDYDVYNDLGNPDVGDDLARPVLGGAQHPYPRRCRTGRPRTKKDPLSESRSVGVVYVPRDEAFSEVKQTAFFGNETLNLVLQKLLPMLEKHFIDGDIGFPNFTAIDNLFIDGFPLPNIPSGVSLHKSLSKFIKVNSDGVDDSNILCFETPDFVERDRFSWLRDAEFARQTLAGINPMCIELVTEWPMKSKLDPDVYGPPESAITTDLVEQDIISFCTVEEALKQKKLFVLDYHDLLLPYVNKVREMEAFTTLYGSRTLFFLTPSGTLMPLAIELTRPPLKGKGKGQWKKVFKPSCNPTDIWLWRLAKSHVLAHDSGVHQLVSHWLRTHCAAEPYVIATNRQLSAMHPIYRLLHPHLRYTMEINALARNILVSADGFIEKSFFPGKYSMELSSFAYDQLWQFDLQALPADLINRGMAVEDPSALHGLKLTIEDYPYANDGLLIWDAIIQWVGDYVRHYYPDSVLVQSDNELQSWWTEIRTVGHGDKKDEPGWPELKTPDDLIRILTTIIWVASGHHAAVNFGQYSYAGYIPNRPSIARTQMPTEDPNEEEKKQFLKRPEAFLLESFPSQIQAMLVMAILDVLSDHSPDEEYIGKEIQPYWEDDKVINAAFQLFSGRLKMIEENIDARNADTNLLNRAGAGVVPYELLKPFSEPGVTGKGVPNSISI